MLDRADHCQPGAGHLNHPGSDRKTGGTIKLNFSGLASGGGSVSNTCLATEFFRSGYSLSGTGKYKHISGREHYTANATEIQPRVNGSWSQNRRPLAFQQVITASGPVKLP